MDTTSICGDAASASQSIIEIHVTLVWPIQEVFHVYLNKFEIAVSDLFFYYI